MTVSANPAALTVGTQPKLSVITVTLPGNVSQQTQVVWSVSSSDTAVATADYTGSASGDKVPGGTLTHAIRVTKVAAGTATVTVTVKVGIAPNFETKTATIAVTVT